MIEGLYPIFNHWHKQGTVWLCSDPHFNDAELAAGIPNRPSGDELVQKINSKVGRKDTLICLGDICDIECVRKLKGYKILLCGNHDAGISNYERQQVIHHFDHRTCSYQEAIKIAQSWYPNWHIYCKNSQTEYEDWIIIADNSLFDEVYVGPLTIGEKIILSHEPLDINWALNIHGHDHLNKAHDPYHFNACLDVNNYEPINFNQFMKAGPTANIASLHRVTINNATKRAYKRGYKLGK